MVVQLVCHGGLDTANTLLVTHPLLDSLGRVQQSCIHLTSSLFVLHQDLQLQQPPGNIWVISHYCQGGLKLPLHTEFYTSISWKYTDAI